MVQRLIGIDHRRDDLPANGVARRHFVNVAHPIHAVAAGQFALIVADGIGAHLAHGVGGTAHQRRHQAGIETATEKTANRHIGHQLPAYGGLKGIAQITYLWCVTIGLALTTHPIHPAVNFQRAIGPPKQIVARQQFVNAGKERLVARHIAEGHILPEGRRIQLRLHLRQGQPRLDLRSKGDAVADMGVVEGLDAKGVSSAEELLLTLIPEGKGKHAV